MPARLSRYTAQQRHRLTTVCIASIVSLVVTAAAQAQTSVMKNCEQTDSAPLVVRACSAILNMPDLSPAERKRILLLRGVGWTKEEDFAAAAEDFSGAIKLQPDNVAALEGRAHALSKLAQHPKATDDWSKLISLQPKNDAYYRNRGTERSISGQHQEALADFDAALAINPKGIEAYMGRAQVFHAMKDRDRANQEFEKGIAVNENYLPLHWARAEMAEEWGNSDLAIASYVKVLKINGVYEDARRRLQRLGVFTPP